MTWGQRIARVQVWWTDNGPAFGVPVAVVVIGAVILVVFLLRPRATGPDQEMVGRVISDVPPAVPQYYNQATVLVELSDGMRLQLDVPPTQTCPPGAAAVVTRTPIKGSQVHYLKSCTTAPQKSDDGPRQAG